MAWRTITNGLIMTWIAFNVLILFRLGGFYTLIVENRIETLIWSWIIFALFTVGGAWGLHYLGNKFIAIRKKNYAKRYPDKTLDSNNQTSS